MPGMDPTRSGPVALAEARLAWLDRRARVLAENIANADTPGFSARDLRPFVESLARHSAPDFARTDARHLSPPGGSGPRARADRLVAERAPNGNSVSLEEQALRVADTDTAHALAMGLHRRFMGLFRTALGRQS